MTPSLSEAGTTGLTTAGYLAKAGIKTLVLEKRSILGGSCVTEEIYPGHNVSTISYIVSLLRDEVVRDLDLKKHGFSMIEMEGKLAICGDDYLYLNYEEEHDRKEIGRFSDTDYDNMERFDRMLQEAGNVVRKIMMEPPVDLEPGLKDIFPIAKLGIAIKKASPENRHRLIQILTSSACDLIERWFDSQMIKNMFAAATFSGNYSSIKTPGSALPFFSMAVGELDGEIGAWRLVKGGMSGIPEAMASFARSKGAEIRVNAPVKEILVEKGRATGVIMEGGEIIRAKCVAANTDPKRTFLQMLNEKHLDPEFRKDIQQIRMGQGSPKLNLALKGLPDIKFFEAGKEGPWHRANINIFPNMKEMDANFFEAAAGRIHKKPRLHMVIPSTVDSTLAPAGHHVMSIMAKYYPYELADGKSWDAIKEEVADDIIDYMSEWMPNLRDLIIGRQFISPLDFEREYGLTEGDIFHGRHDLDQLYNLRPHPKAAQYRTPIKGLYMCGSGTHPGGGVTGAPGHNAAKRIIADIKRSENGKVTYLKSHK